MSGTFKECVCHLTHVTVGENTLACQHACHCASCGSLDVLSACCGPSLQAQWQLTCDEGANAFAGALVKTGRPAAATGMTKLLRLLELLAKSR